MDLRDEQRQLHSRIDSMDDTLNNMFTAFSQITEEILGTPQPTNESPNSDHNEDNSQIA